MSEINNFNYDVKPIMPQEQISSAKKAEETNVEKETKTIQDFSNPKAEALGRSQITKTDSVKTDVKFLKENFDTVQSAEKFFEIAYKQLVDANEKDPYEKACTMAAIYAQEITK